jgi:hypothetical protein
MSAGSLMALLMAAQSIEKSMASLSSLMGQVGGYVSVYRVFMYRMHVWMIVCFDDKHAMMTAGCAWDKCWRAGVRDHQEAAIHPHHSLCVCVCGWQRGFARHH